MNHHRLIFNSRVLLPSSISASFLCLSLLHFPLSPTQAGLPALAAVPYICDGHSQFLYAAEHQECSHTQKDLGSFDHVRIYSEECQISEISFGIGFTL